jgi:hypothetical protein
METRADTPSREPRKPSLTEEVQPLLDESRRHRERAWAHLEAARAQREARRTVFGWLLPRFWR